MIRLPCSHKMFINDNQAIASRARPWRATRQKLGVPLIRRTPTLQSTKTRPWWDNARWSPAWKVASWVITSSIAKHHPPITQVS